MKYLNITLLILFLSNGLLAHGGGLNKDGCHNDRKNGGYHCHRSSSSSMQGIPQQNNFKLSESTINTRWCDSRGGIVEFRTKDGTYVDCLTDTYAVEAEFDNKWKEAIGQSLHYAESTNRRAAIQFIKRQNSRKDYYGEMVRVINKYQLPITIYTINQ